MKKLAIAGASVALAAMPVVGVFAVTTTDTLTLTVPAGCNITSRTNTVAAFNSVAPGNTQTASTDSITVTCNAAWQLTPSVSAGNELKKDASNVISSSASLSGATSAWALQLAVSGTSGTIGNAFETNNEVDGTNKLTASAAGTGVSVTPTYTVYVAPGQTPGDYTGTVVYTIAEQ